ncbi:glucose-6-phosphate dehydrogenase [Corynebacterium suedekumii]|uniref:Glucose-6-phosphate dehydrogenase n=1 Tax=Corynebacterium suedekumii TaxID=3049801 RepID=A0ABY8VKP0_9CORY|nr:glucose-6-phosphate dehydrogenase [Corynebacterium suedekumii]WIM70216.1 glucose-6-phosphate dehydrogenase [Corynebacterium suedekumii]
MTSPVTFIILGGAGDLARRLLIPGIGEYLAQHGDAAVRLVAVGQEDVPDYPGIVHESMKKAGLPEELFRDASYRTADATSAADLRNVLDGIPTDGRAIIYFALPPAVTEKSVAALKDVTLPGNVVLALEKPFGDDAAGADALDTQLLTATDEDHVFRVDHFICESAVSNLVNLVAANAPFAASWSGRHIELVDITFDETLALEGRAEFYDNNGATRDMIQSHLLQVMAHVLAVGGSSGPGDILDATAVIPGTARRARYTAGTIDSRQLPSYVDEEGVDPDRGRETLVQLDLKVDTEQWKGVRVRLRSGKAVGDPQQAIAVTYRIPEGAEEVTPARLVLPFTDDIFLELNVPDHGYRDNLQRVTLHSDLVPSRLSPYGRVVRALIDDDHRVEVPVGAPQRSWEILQPVLDAFTAGEIPMEEYPAGSCGPAAW